jgi:hypothetical protein
MYERPRRAIADLEAIAGTMCIASSAACVLLALSGCANVASRITDPTATDVPAAWSVTSAAAAPAATALVEWWARGGLLRIVIATAASYGLSGVMGVPYSFDWSISLLALVFSAFIGVVFGYFLARSAARVEPMEAPRHE